MKKKKILALLILAAAALMCAVGASAWEIEGNDSDRVIVPCIVTVPAE